MKSAPTRIENAAGVQFLLPEGTTRAAREGETVPRGSVVLTKTSGARLVTLEREVHLGEATQVRVVNGAEQELRVGHHIVDARDAPGVTTRTEATETKTPEGGLVRVEAGILARTVNLGGPDTKVRAQGRRATSDVPAYHQVQTPRGGLNGAVTVAALTGDPLEGALAPELTNVNELLKEQAARLGEDESRTVLASLETRADPLTVAYQDTGRTGLLADQGRAAPSERAFAEVLAETLPAETRLRGEEKTEEILENRQEGGSWGPVALVAGADPEQVRSVLDRLLDPAGAALLLDLIAAALGSGPETSTEAAIAPAGDGAGDGAGGEARDSEGAPPGRAPGGDAPETSPPAPDAPETEEPGVTDPVKDTLPPPVRDVVEDVEDTLPPPVRDVVEDVEDALPPPVKDTVEDTKETVEDTLPALPSPPPVPTLPNAVEAPSTEPGDLPALP